MSATQTTNLGLNKPDRQDYVSVFSDINQNMDRIDSSVGNIITPVFSPSTAYSVGDYVIYNRELYRFTTAHPAGSWNSSHVAKTNLAQESNSLKSALSDTTGNEIIQFSDYSEKKYIYLSAVGTTTSITPQTMSSGCKYAVIEVAIGDKFTLNGTGGHSYNRLYGWLDENYKVLARASADTPANNMQFVCEKIGGETPKYLCINTVTENAVCYKGFLVKSELDALNVRIDNTNQRVDDLEDTLIVYGDPSGLTWRIGNIGSTGLDSTQKNTIRSTKVNATKGDIITPLNGYYIRVFIYDKTTGDFLLREDWTNTAYTINSDCKIRVLVGDSTHYSDVTYVLTDTSYSQNVSFHFSIGEIKDFIPHTVYVATNGNDNNMGTESSPFATISKAIDSGGNIIMINGGKYSQVIDLSKANGGVHLINNTPTQEVVILSPDCVIATSEESVSGYSNVHSASVSATFSANNKWIFQDGVADGSTLISDADRLPQQRGNEYRCDDTKIQRCESATLSDALTEIENATDYRWFYDNGILYFSRPSAVSPSNPICASFGGTLFTNSKRNMSVEMTGINVKYMSINLDGTANSIISDCKVSNVFGDGCYTYNQCCNAKFVRCEAERAFSGSGGDGFNAHSSTIGDTFSKQTTCTLIDCWSHDINDDGYSDHERCETTIIGGLFEYCMGSGGITPAAGSHCSCHDVISRYNNADGFGSYESATAAEGGKGTQMLCFNCIAKGNGGRGFSARSDGNSSILYNCNAIENGYGYRASGNANMYLFNCCANGNTTEKDATGGGTITVSNSTLVN